MLTIAPSLTNVLHKKMRFSQIVFRSRHHAKARQNPDKVPFKELHPLALKNSVNEGTKTSMEDKCLFEISLLFRCWNENEFNDKNCQTYMQKVQDCYRNYMKISAKEKELQKIDIPTPDAKKFTNKQINYLLRMYPNV